MLPPISGGGGEIRTHERLATLPVFKTGAFNRSATPPSAAVLYARRHIKLDFHQANSESLSIELEYLAH